jgi:hypothetical protein
VCVCVCVMVTKQESDMASEHIVTSTVLSIDINKANLLAQNEINGYLHTANFDLWSTPKRANCFCTRCRRGDSSSSENTFVILLVE